MCSVEPEVTVSFCICVTSVFFADTRFIRDKPSHRTWCVHIGAEWEAAFSSAVEVAIVPRVEWQKDCRGDQYDPVGDRSDVVEMFPSIPRRLPEGAHSADYSLTVEKDWAQRMDSFLALMPHYSFCWSEGA